MQMCYRKLQVYTDLTFYAYSVVWASKFYENPGHNGILKINENFLE